MSNTCKCCNSAKVLAKVKFELKRMISDEEIHVKAVHPYEEILNLIEILHFQYTQEEANGNN